MKTAAFSRTQLTADLKRLGVRPGDVLVVHSSFKSLGPVDGGPATLIAALQAALTARGTLIMPAFAYNFERAYAPVEPYDPRTTPSRVGAVAETFRQLPGVLRSAHPTHSFAAWGLRAGEIIEDDESPSALGPLHRAARHAAKVLLIGCGFTSLTLLHVAEELAAMPYLPIANWGHVGWKPTALAKDERGRPRPVVVANMPGCSRHFGVAAQLAEEHGLLCKGRLATAATLLVEAAPLLDLVVKRLRDEPDFLLCRPGGCPACNQRRVVFEPKSADAAEIGRFMIDVVSRCGCRLAGSPGEELAAEIIARRMRSLGLENVETLSFPVQAWKPGHSRLEFLVDDTWEACESFPVSHSPASRAKTIEGRTMQVESFADLDKLGDASGRIAVLWDGYGESRAEFRRLMQAGFAALILVDRRFAHDDVVAAGVPAQWLPEFTTPAVSLAHAQALRWFGQGDRPCRLQVDGRTVAGSSTIVSGEIAGTQPGTTILLCGHHDTTANSAAPDDNLSGVAAVLQAAAILTRGKRRPRHTVRFCSFGAEEQLSEGARWYAFESGRAGDVRFVINADSVGARCGSTVIYQTGGEDLARWLRRQTRRSPLQFKRIEELRPFSDHFPFNCRGVPSLWFSRQTVTAGRHYHHTVRDALDAVSFNYLAELAGFLAALAAKLASRERLPFASEFSPKWRKAITAARKAWLE